MSGVAQWKKDTIKELRKKIESHPTIAVIDMTDLPAQQLQIIRHKLRDKADIQMSRKRLLVRALEESNKEEANRLVKEIKGLPALLFSNESAFELFKILKKNMSDAPAKAGQTAPKDVVIKKGATEFPAGPVISELQGLGIKSGIEKGKVVIKEDKILVKEGEELNKEQAGILSRLGMKPMKIGINLLSALEKQDLYPKEALDIDIDNYKNKVQEAYQNTFKLSVALGLITEENVKHLVQKAHSDVKKLALGAEIVTDETKEELIKKAESQVKALKEKVGDIKVEEAHKETKQDDKKEGMKKEKPKEEKAEEKKEKPKEEKTEEKEVEVKEKELEPPKISKADLGTKSKSSFVSLKGQELETKPEKEATPEATKAKEHAHDNEVDKSSADRTGDIEAEQKEE